MEFEILSRKNAITYSYQTHDKTSAIISISNSYDLYPKFARFSDNNIKDILFLFFDDIEDFEIRSSQRYYKKDEGEVFDSLLQTHYQLCTTNIAKNIVDFVLLWKDKVDKIIVHCEAGVSRSSGVCAAIKKALTGNDTDIFGSLRYYPNMTCYNLVLKEFAERGYINGRFEGPEK